MTGNNQMTIGNKILIAIVFLMVIGLLEAKKVNKKYLKSNLQTSENGLFITKFDFGTNGGEITINTIKRESKHDTERNIFVDLVLDQNLQKYLNSQCQKREPYRSQMFTFHPKQYTDKRRVMIPAQTHEHIIYLYFVVCLQNQTQIFQQAEEQLVFEVTMLNDGSHAGEDEKFLMMYVLLVGIWCEMLYRFAYKAGKIIFDSKDNTKVTVFVTLIVIGIAYFYRLIHLSLYYTNGKGIVFFETLYIILKSACEFTIVTVLVAWGWGWSLIHLKHDESYIIAGAIAMIINAVGLIVDIFAEEMVDVHHKYDSTSGYILQFLRVFVFFIFVLGVARSLSLSVGNMRVFIKKMALVGGVYLLSWPAIVLFAEVLLPNYMHNEVITLVEEFTHIVATRVLCSMLAYPESTYRKVSIKEDDNPLNFSDYKKT